MLNPRTTKQLRWAAATLATLGLTALPVATTQAQERAATVTMVKPAAVVKVSSSAIKKMRATWKTYGVSKKTQDKLIAKLKAGKAWDSLKKKKAKKTKTYTRGGYRTKVYTYADGSVRIASMQLPSKPVSTSSMKMQPAYVAACTVNQGHYFYSATGCIASDNVVLFGARMTINYGAAAGDKAATIAKPYDQYAWTVLGTATWEKPQKISNSEYHMTFAINGLPTGTFPQILTVKATSLLTVEARANA